MRGLRAIKAEIIKAKTEPGAGGEVDEATELKMLQKMMKQRKDAFDIFKQQSREDLAVKEEEEMSIIKKFLPTQMSQEDLQRTIETIISSVNATSPADMGKVMGVASKQLAGKADGKAISETVKQLLNKS